jgi:hypothetical protein
MGEADVTGLIGAECGGVPNTKTPRPQFVTAIGADCVDALM